MHRQQWFILNSSTFVLVIYSHCHLSLVPRPHWVWYSMRIGCQCYMPSAMYSIHEYLEDFTASLWARFNKTMLSYQYKKSHCGNITTVRWFYPHNENICMGSIISWYLNGTQNSQQSKYHSLSKYIEAWSSGHVFFSQQFLSKTFGSILQ